MAYLVLLTEKNISGMPEDDSEEQHTTKTLLGFRDEEEAAEALIGYYESQDYEYQVRAKEIGYVDNIQIPIELILPSKDHKIQWVNESIEEIRKTIVRKIENADGADGFVSFNLNVPIDLLKEEVK